jgi:signal transduction histidine kinase
MGGRIEVASKVGEGTTFSLFLPAADEDELGNEPRLLSAGAH